MADNHERTNQAIAQGVFYIVGFMVMYIPMIIAQAASLFPGEPPLPRGYYGELWNFILNFCPESNDSD